MTGCQKILRKLEQDGSVTGMDCFKMGVMNYKGRIYDLRRAGYNIRTDREEGKNMDGEPVIYARYVLVKL